MAKKSRRSPVSKDKRFKRQNGADYGTQERWQHSGRTLEYTETAGVFAARATEEHLLDKLLMMRLVDEAEREAGLKLHHDYHMAGIETRLTASYASVRTATRNPEARLERSDMEEAAYQRWRNALRATPIAMRDVVIHVACIGMPPSMMQLPKLKAGLFQLARFYGLVR